MYEIIGFILLGAGVGIISSFLGFGGGTLIVPFLPIIAAIDIKSTIATSLATVTLNATNNTYNFNKKKLIKWKLVFTVTSASIIFAILSSRLTHWLDSDIVRWLVIFIFCLIVLVIYLGPQKVPLFIRKDHVVNHVLAGVLAGTVAGLGGIGGATILVPLLIVGRWTEPQEMSPTGNAINAVTALSSVSTLILSNEKVEWRAVFIILFVSSVVSHFARKKQHLLSENNRRVAIFVFMVSVIFLQVAKALKWL